jgi:predicted nucleic acid-binding protein
MKIYLDSCSLQRPLDSKEQIRIALEAEAVLAVLSLCESGSLDLVSSEPLIFEARRSPNVARKEYAFEVLHQAKIFIQINEEIEHRAKGLTEIGIKPLDALHLASAEQAQADYFCTCDDKFLKKAKSIHKLKTKIVSPIELIEEIERWKCK